MGSEMNIYYDEEGDYLEIASGDISESYFENLGNGIFQIIDKKTKETKGFAVFSFKKRTRSLDMIKLSLPFKLEIA